jgi:hypothetical protein
MTDIPGTGKVLVKEKDPLNFEPTPISVINIKDLKRAKEEPEEKSLNFYDNFYFWLATGIAISLIFLLISFRYKGFIVFVFLGPTASVLSWYVRKLLKKYEAKPKRYSS